MSRYKFDKWPKSCLGFRTLVSGRRRSVAVEVVSETATGKVQEFNCVQRRESGFYNHYEFVLHAGAKAKTVTSNLPLLSVLCVAFFCLDKDIHFIVCRF